ncbi:hypothetical protein VCHA53O463_110101 [Vibrio chagasii]|nr:hypothetical protein VCHA35P150_20452 [Vibrio chagasii]CAH6906967.1 hypothetical protein VCHA56P515_100061 [Vibrio chagasii]CAH6967432.1 hypothetical protein VCHA53O463_110101 [Vibrio chagasii]CAH7385060.1 hypothetical protein VCHA53O464_20016 [Vibrio chagasii]
MRRKLINSQILKIQNISKNESPNAHKTQILEIGDFFQKKTENAENSPCMRFFVTVSFHCFSVVSILTCTKVVPKS